MEKKGYSKNIVGKEKMLETRIFSFSSNVYNTFTDTYPWCESNLR